MRDRETKYADGKSVLAAVSWNGGFHQAYRDGKLLPADMPDEESRITAELVQMYMTLGEQHWERLKAYLEGMPDAE